MSDDVIHIEIWLVCLGVWVFVCLYPINVKTADICGTSRDHREGLWMINKCVLKVFDFVKKIKFLKIRGFFLNTDLSKPYQVDHLGEGGFRVICLSNMHNIIIFESLLLGELVFRKIHTRMISSTRKLLILIISLVFFLWPFWSGVVGQFISLRWVHLPLLF